MLTDSSVANASIQEALVDMLGKPRVTRSTRREGKM
jgi:hypothetical protein